MGPQSRANSETVTRNPGAQIVLPTEDEWYKAAYYNPATSSYFDYPAGSNSVMNCAAPTATQNSANCNNAVGGPTIVGSYTGSASPYGTFDQGGNVSEWNETMILYDGRITRGLRGGRWIADPDEIAAFYRGLGDTYAEYEAFGLGFRLAMIPEPGTGLLVLAGLVGLGLRRRVHVQLCLLMAVIALSAVPMSGAAYEINSSSDPALASASVIDFESRRLGVYTEVTINGVNFAARPGTGSRIEIRPFPEFNPIGTVLTNHGNTPNATNLITITFAEPVGAFGFNRSASTLWTLTAHIESGSVLGSRILPSGSLTTGFFGLGFETGIAWITLTGDNRDVFALDNVTYAAAPVPEPSSALLVITGLVGLAARRSMRD